MDLTACLRPEDELLLCCARTSIDANRAEQIRALLQEDLDWAHLIEIASLNGVMPLLYRSLSATCPEAVPGAVMEQLRDQFEANTRYNLFLTAELLKLLDLLETHGIPALPFKGPVLAASVYGDLGLRQFNDLDVLVRQRDVLRAGSLLASRGYQSRPGGCEFVLTDTQEAAFLRTACDYSFVSDDGQLAVELHWRFAPKFFSFPFDPESLWARVQLVPLAGRRVPSLPPEDLILILCMHGSKHLWERLSWICDVAELIRVYPQLEWGCALEQARMLGSERMLLLGLLLARNLLDIPLPPVALQAIEADPAVASLAELVERWLCHETDGPPTAWPYVQLFHLSVRENFQDRVRYGLHWAIMPSVGEWDYLRLPPSLYFLYYLIRPIRVVKKCGQGVLRSLLSKYLQG